jgi:hypothetical protein
MAEYEIIEAHASEVEEWAKEALDWLGFKVHLSHKEAHDIASGASKASVLIPDKKVAAAVQHLAGTLTTACALGGHKGVCIYGSWIIPGTVVLPCSGP